MSEFRDPIEWEDTLGIRPSSPAWRATVKAIYGSPLATDERALLETLTGGAPAPDGGARDVLVVAGRRGGKSETTARIAVFEAIHGGHARALAPGQIGVIPIVSPLREQSLEILRYATGLTQLPAVRRHLATDPTAHAITFRGGVEIRVMTCSDIALSGVTSVMAILDEFAKWPGSESETPDSQIVASLRPSLAPVRGAPPRRLIAITSAFLTEGVAYETERACFGKVAASTFVVRGPTTTWNPNIDAEWLASERRRAPRDYAREYECEWQSAITDGWFGPENVARAVDKGRRFTAAKPGTKYIIAIDQAFRTDRFTIAGAHAERRADGAVVAILDFSIALNPPISAESAAERVARVAHQYGTRTVLADQFGFEPLRAVFSRHGVHLSEVPWTGQSKPSRFRATRDAMLDGRVRLVDQQPTINEFHNISGKLLRSGGEQIEARRGHDDLVSSAVLALSEVLMYPPSNIDVSKIAPPSLMGGSVGLDAMPASIEAFEPISDFIAARVGARTPEAAADEIVQRMLAGDAAAPKEINYR